MAPEDMPPTNPEPDHSSQENLGRPESGSPLDDIHEGLVANLSKRAAEDAVRSGKLDEELSTITGDRRHNPGYLQRLLDVIGGYKNHGKR